MSSTAAGFAERFRNRFSSYIDGRFIEDSGEPQAVVDPSRDRVWAELLVDLDQVTVAVDAAAAAQSAGWADSAAKRSETLRAVAALVEAEAEALAEFETLATGKPIAATRAEVVHAAVWYRYYASVIETEREQSLSLSATKSAQIRQEPIGVIGAITPFNGAFSLGAWKFAPALAAGNAVVVKPPVASSISTLLLAELMTQAGLPPGLFNVVLGDAAVGTRLVDDPRVGAVTFTGSTGVGRAIGARVAGRMGRFVCEAGGKSAHIVMDDADLASAVIAAAQGVFSGSGQTCVAGSRLLVHRDVYDEFVSRFVAQASKLMVGDPMSEGVHLGPIATAAQYRRVRDLIDGAVAEGASVLLDGRDPDIASGDANGFWVGPTILGDVGEDAVICRTEVFGPVVVVQRVDSFDEAIVLANDSDFGLAAGIWTGSQARAHEAASRLAAGTVWINTYRGMDWRTPFGGYKQSGLGRENGIEALHEFRQFKTVVQDVAPAVDPFGIA
ncbi:aldehyde dehydrogenase [Leucobacter sp. wl10]|uniref:aldehyde dehydrogenase family protein n=1 Tax=Leucobacter sp. wl10 TaxID=2304677 RepID=UPI000E5C3440|nr:aldehyde dehydrogenase family protein [Leucobacter sp. wl10]RGE23156.1 aldehyde dehydrogenase family protein [Leucobacter sp. wl10]